MKIKLDENLSADVAGRLAALGHDVDTVPEEGLQGKVDPDIWAASQREARFLVTQDLDFSDIRRFPPGTHHGLLIVRLADPTRSAIANRVAEVFATEAIERWPGCIVVATDCRVRVRRP